MHNDLVKIKVTITLNNFLQMLNLSEYSNISPRIIEKFGRNLHNLKNHPLEIIKNKIYSFPKFENFKTFDNLSPIVNIKNNFDKLLIPKNNPARRKSDTYYIDQNTVLRTHTSAHESEIMSQGIHQFLVTGDVYRKDEIDRCHYPIFHQMEGVCLLDDDKDSVKELLDTLTNLVEFLFPNCKSRVNNDYFPFTNPSFEIEVEYNGKWLEILGCGILQPEIMQNNGLENKTAWAFGLGLERLAMILFNIPDIRYFWSQHPRFSNQFESGEIIQFKQFSVLDSQFQDMSFWIPPSYFIEESKFEEGQEQKFNRWIQDNDFFDIIRNIGGDLIELVSLEDEFFHSKKQLHSRMYRFTYSPNDPSLKNPSTFLDIVMNTQNKIRKEVSKQLSVTLR